MSTSKFIATEDLKVGVHLAHLAGDEVPADNIERNGWAGKVREVKSPAAQERVLAEVSPAEYDPKAHTVDEVVAYLESASPEERERVQLAEAAGRGRTGIIGF